jgi:hypothetical protein
MSERKKAFASPPGAAGGMTGSLCMAERYESDSSRVQGEAHRADEQQRMKLQSIHSSFICTMSTSDESSAHWMCGLSSSEWRPQLPAETIRANRHVWGLGVAIDCEARGLLQLHAEARNFFLQNGSLQFTFRLSCLTQCDMTRAVSFVSASNYPLTLHSNRLESR